MESEIETSAPTSSGAENKGNANAGGNILLIVFKLGAEEYALSIDQIKEVVLTPRISKIPQTPPYIKGVANIRGNVISIIDLGELFGLISGDESVENKVMEESSDKDVEMNSNYTLVIESEEHKIGVLVKEVPNTLSVNASGIDNSSNIIRHSALDENAINGIVKLDNRMIILIDILNLMKSGHIKASN